VIVPLALQLQGDLNQNKCLKMSNVYIATTECMTAKLYDAEYIADKFYPQHLTSERL